MRATKSQEKENQADYYHYYYYDFPRFLVNFLGSRRRRRPTTKRHISINNGHPQEPTTTSQKRNIEIVREKSAHTQSADEQVSWLSPVLWLRLMCRLYYIVNGGGGGQRTIYHVDVARFLPSSPTTTPWLLQWKRHLYMYRPPPTHTPPVCPHCVCVCEPPRYCFDVSVLSLCVCVW